jgi:hypothetical protein
MALYEQHDPRARAGDPGYARRPSPLSTGAVVLIFAAIVAVLMFAVLYPGSASSVGGTSTGPSLQTVTPAPSPTTEPRPTQAPQP